MQTKVIDFGAYQRTGFVGRVQYDLPMQMAVLALALIRLARFSGIGRWCGQGFGQAEPLEEVQR